ncbi:pore-forming ESAT-6 family protein [Pseudonocardia humida]|uniref:Pore-forming ESAT-6 family protein n=1 Tax=Pseudonocardia humida TaxID=2800819 RepID=A0ABT1A6C6_9PSEU|nr:pore-forming ESAT-6 family protein [Pseudonocardia humida]MCO1658379.1 pore-forming ESAT-6 family protein [Pseudonocardia humida]
MPSTDRRSFDTGVSQQVQSDLGGIVARLEANISQRQTDVATAMSDFQADGVDDQYRTVEQRWNNAATQVREIIALVRTTMTKNDDSATSALTRARGAVDSIG